MIIIECEGEYSWGGRTRDTFVLDDFNSLDELQDYITNKQPIKAKTPTSYYKYTIIEEESLRDRIVYLNNYLNIKKVCYYIMTRDEINKLNNNVCKGCKFNDGSISSAFRCKFYKDEDSCSTKQESFSFRKLFIKDKR